MDNTDVLLKLQSLEIVLIGTDGRNGLRSDVRELHVRVEKLEDDLAKAISDVQHYIEVERHDDCLGKKALAEHIEDHKEDANVQVAKLTGAAQIKQAFINAIPSVLTIILVGGAFLLFSVDKLDKLLRIVEALK